MEFDGRTGFIAILDVLGIGSASLKKCQEFNEFFNNISLNKIANEIRKFVNNKKDDFWGTDDFQTRIFQDTIIIDVPCHNFTFQNCTVVSERDDV